MSAWLSNENVTWDDCIPHQSGQLVSQLYLWSSFLPWEAEYSSSSRG